MQTYSNQITGADCFSGRVTVLGITEKYGLLNGQNGRNPQEVKLTRKFHLPILILTVINGCSSIPKSLCIPHPWLAVMTKYCRYIFEWFPFSKLKWTTTPKHELGIGVAARTLIHSSMVTSQRRMHISIGSWQAHILTGSLNITSQRLNSRPDSLQTLQLIWNLIER